MHLQHATAHPPDSVLFPFLHGLEGNNEPQCSFFASTPSTAASAAAGLVQDPSGRAICPPRYRGLVWVLCDEDVDGELPQLATAPTRWEDDLVCDDSDSSEYSTDQPDIDRDVEFDDLANDAPPSHPVPCPMDMDPPPQQEPHMHPLALRIPTSNHAHHLPHDRRHSNASSSDSTSTDASASSSLANSDSDSTAATSLASPPCYSSSHAAYQEQSQSILGIHDSGVAFVQSAPQHAADPHKRPPILTSTFVPSQLIQPSSCDPLFPPIDDWEESINWEFKPVVVPDGISLRNFGIQVPLYPTISDIVIYSPRGASPAALRLAARFRRAVEKKLAERLDRWAHARGETPRTERALDEHPHITPEGFLKYGVYILDADAPVIERELPWMIMHRDGECDGSCAGDIVSTTGGCCADSGCPGRCTVGAAACRCDPTRRRGYGSGALTESTDGRLVGELEIEAELDARELHSPPRPIVTRSRSHTLPYHAREGQRPHRDRQLYHSHTAPDAHQTSANGSTCTQPPMSDDRDTSYHHCFHTQFLPSTCMGSRKRHHLHRCKHANTIDFAQREKEEMRDLTRASEIITLQNDRDESHHTHASGSTTNTYWDPHAGQVFLGNSNDVPLWAPFKKKRKNTKEPIEKPSPFDSDANSPALGRGFDICIECHEYAPLPGVPHLHAAEQHIRALEMEWVERCQRDKDGDWMDADEPCTPPRPPPHPSAMVHLPFPSSQQAMPSILNALFPLIRFLERVITPGWLDSGCEPGSGASAGRVPRTPAKGPHYLQSPGSPPLPQRSIIPEDRVHVCTNGTGTLENGNGRGSYGARDPAPLYNARPLKVLLYSSDGYTESSVPALCLLMVVKELSLPEAYLELQVVKRRSFFVYQMEVGLLKKVEARLGAGNGQGRPRCYTYGSRDMSRGLVAPSGHSATEISAGSGSSLRPLILTSSSSHQPGIRSTALPAATMPNVLGVEEMRPAVQPRTLRRPRASTLPAFIPDHQSWFDDARFDGSFPSRVLPFLYLGNLNHASNAYMLHALGITHVVSVGECALVPPPQTDTIDGDAAPTFLPYNLDESTSGQGPGGQGSLWIEEREGRIKVLDIKGVCDDGIDTLEHQLHPVCSWIEKARQSGGQVLVHCRVGVSRSATVTIAYMMQHLGLSLVESYLVVRSRRLSVLIQPNMRLLYNLLGWEVRLARERAGGDERKLREELRKALSWPYLAREVHALNEKYLS